MNGITCTSNILISSDSDSDSDPDRKPNSNRINPEQNTSGQPIEILFTSDSDTDNDKNDDNVANGDEIIFGKYEILPTEGVIKKNKVPNISKSSSSSSEEEKIITEENVDNDSDEIVFGKYEIIKTETESKKSIKKELLNQISLSSSDEEMEVKPVVTSKKTTKKKAQKKSSVPELFTSDEDEDEDKPSTSKKSPKKRKSDIKAEIGGKRVKANEENSNADVDIFPGPSWKDYELLAEHTNVEPNITRNLIKLLEEGNTIPFIARYRKNVVGNLPPEELRSLKEGYDKICTLKKRMSCVLKSISKVGKLDEKLQTSIYASKTIDELDHLYTPFKPVGNKRSLAERAKELGLEQPAVNLLKDPLSNQNPERYVNINVDGIKTKAEVELRLIHIMSAEIATDFHLIQFIRNMKKTIKFELVTKRIKRDGTVKLEDTKKKRDSVRQELKFELYFDFSQCIHLLKPHQVLAINRGESLKILSVKVLIPQNFKTEVFKFCEDKWSLKYNDSLRDRLLEAALKDSYTRYIVSFITRVIRTELKETAEKEACKVFSENLKHLLLTAPVKGKVILGIDPGFSNGCKLAVISTTGSLLAYNVIYPHAKWHGDRGETILKKLLLDFNCDTIGIGNGTACRETETWISGLIKAKFFGNLNVRYVIINEDGASIYSCSPEAKKEFDQLDPNIISAVSLARRLQDPMAELVKVEPCHLGIGMYQLDLKKRQLEEVLNDVVSECVSFVGVDLNTASQCLLKRVAGLTDRRAAQIISYREQNGPFTRRRELMEVYGIGERIFEQCAGFLRVCPIVSTVQQVSTPAKEKILITPLDATIIHPESYRQVRCLLKSLKLKENEIGSSDFIQEFNKLKKTENFTLFAKKYSIDEETMNLIIDALSKPLNYDFRLEDSSSKPLFRSDIKTFDQLEEGCVLTGRVTNVTSFGAFIDVGVNVNGLLHKSKWKNEPVHLGQQIQVKVTKIDTVKQQIAFELISTIF